MITLDQLGKEFKRNVLVVEMQTKGLSHADSLLQPETRGNCMNWVLGHMAVSRDTVLTWLGEEGLLAEAERERYGRYSEPILEDGEDVMQLERVLELFNEGQASIEAALAKHTLEDMDKMTGEEGKERRLGDRLIFYFFHDCYHTGQLEYLRQLAGTDDEVI